MRNLKKKKKKGRKQEKKSTHYNLEAYQAVSRGGNVKTNKVEQS